MSAMLKVGVNTCMGAILTGSLSTSQSTSKNLAKPVVPLPDLFWSFLKIGAFTFGGGWAMIPLIRKELVNTKGWCDDQKFVDMLSIAQSGPGPIVVNTATIIGLKIRKIPGAVVAVLGSVLPSFLLIFSLAAFLAKFQSSSILGAVFLGMRPAIFGLLLSASLQVSTTCIDSRRDALFALAAVVLVVFFKFNPIFVVLFAGLAGILFGKGSRFAECESNVSETKES